MKKIISRIYLPVLALGLALGCALPSGPGYDGAENSGSRLIVTSADPMGANVNYGDTATIASDVELSNIPILDESQASDIYIHSYDIEFFSQHPKAVFLSPFKGIGVYAYVAKGGSASLLGIPIIFASTKQEYAAKAAASGTLALEVPYKAIVTFHGENEFGFNVHTSFTFGAVFGDYGP